MSIFSKLPFGKKNDAAPAKETVPARIAAPGCDLSDPDVLARPFVQDPFFRLRPPFSHHAALLSMELADVAYTLDIAPWRQAGWNDFSILIDDSLQSGLTHWESGDALAGAINRIKLLRARAALREPSPVSQLLSALRQKDKSDTVKAVCMMHPLEGGRWLLAIGFMGTGRRFYDWFSNFRFTPEEGFHRGFSQLCESFEMHVDDIVFPSVASALGLEKLTLGSVLSDMRSLSSRFRLWMAGHSQGGAVMQMFTHRLMTDWGVLPQNMVGYGFASPTVATGKFVYDPAAYPLYHIQNADDVVTKLGALLHLGLCMEYTPDAAFRSAVYPALPPEDEATLQELSFFTGGIVDTASAVVYMTALIECLAQEKGAEGLDELMSSWWSIPAVDRVLGRAGDRALEYLQRLLESLREGHLALTGRPADEALIADLRARLRPIVQKRSVRRLITPLTAWTAARHTLVEDGTGAYAAILRNAMDELKPFIWIKTASGLPVKRWGEWADAQPRTESLCVRRTRARCTQHHSKLRLSHTAHRK